MSRNNVLHSMPLRKRVGPAKKAREKRSLSLSISQRKVLLVVGDLAVVNGAYLLSLLLGAGRAIEVAASIPQLALSHIFWFPALSILWVLAARINECYEVRGAANLLVTGRRILVALVQIGIVCTVLFYYFVQLPPIPRTAFLFFFPSSFILLLLWRSLYWLVFRMAPFKQKVIIVGAGWAGRTIARELQHYMKGEYALLGFVDDDPNKQGQSIEGVRVLGRRDDLLPLARELGVQELVLSITRDIHDHLYETLIEAQESGIAVTPMAILYEHLTGRVPVEHINDYWYTGLPTAPNQSTFYPVCKRAVDIVVAFGGLIATSLLSPFVALAIRLDSPGPIFYHQERVGQNGRIFRLLKFRSMVMDAEAGGKPIWATENDARVTRAGRLLRITRMDELPQLMNVFRGEMSLVGPRPERPAFVEELQRHIPFYRSRLLVKPGLTGWAQVNYRYGNTVEDALIKLQYDLYYIKRQSLFLDLLICLKTLWVVVSCKGT